MTQQMYDAVTPSNVPATATLVAGYVDGHFANVDQMRARFPHAAVVGISVFAGNKTGDVLDVENGDATAAEVPAWVLARRAAGHPAPCVYTSEDNWSACIAECRKAGIADPLWWIAKWDGNPGLTVGMWAKQYLSTFLYDLSTVAGPWPGIQIGTDMTPDDLLNTEINCYGDQPPTRTVRDILGYQDFEHHAIQQGIAAINSQLSAVNAAINAINIKLGIK